MMPPGRRTVYCSDKCRRAFEREHFWPRARATARRRGLRSCINGCEGRIEVNHIAPLVGAGYGPSCSHHQANLELLCATCHREVTALQRAQRKTQLGDDLPLSAATAVNLPTARSGDRLRSSAASAASLPVTQRRKGKDRALATAVLEPQSCDALDREWAKLGLSAPARRALVNAGLLSLGDLARVTERQLLSLHGFGPSSLPKLRFALVQDGTSFAAE